ncbi:FecR family protein [Chitinophaga sp. 22321]|uniref:FecR domain-containing protein n=1 Tax=Chitinophaga hostae TaxID=2831022 RepID=A0ABS5J2A4_9BACT|nr:FecR domain-containing protein [Chitinophaga hostae]MBS0029334.1 FecR domain-containing protein [Chitinophaga hostae]
MEENKDRIKALFIKQAQGKATAEEQEQLLAWLLNEPAPDALPEVEDVWIPGTGSVMPAPDAAAVWNTIMEASPEAIVIPWWKKSGFRVAAALIPLIGLASLAVFYYREKNDRRVFVNNTKQVQTIQLEDGTVIRLNQHSRLSLNKSFTAGNRREVWLSGEAFFTVHHQATKPFIVHAANLVDVNVLGTAFNVNTANGTAAVVLNEGSVKVNAGTPAQPVSLLLKPGEKASFDAKTQVLSRQKVDTLFQTSWKYNLLAFKSEPLKIVMQKLAEQYDYKVAFEEKDMEQLLFTGYLPTNNLQQAILTIEQSFNLKFILQHNIIHVNNKKIL